MTRQRVCHVAYLPSASSAAVADRIMGQQSTGRNLHLAIDQVQKTGWHTDMIAGRWVNGCLAPMP